MRKSLSAWTHSNSKIWLCAWASPGDEKLILWKREDYNSLWVFYSLSWCGASCSSWSYFRDWRRVKLIHIQAAKAGTNVDKIKFPVIPWTDGQPLNHWHFLNIFVDEKIINSIYGKNLSLRKKMCLKVTALERWEVQRLWIGNNLFK